MPLRLFVQGVWWTCQPTATTSWTWKKICLVRDKLCSGYQGSWWIRQGTSYQVSDGYSWLRVAQPLITWRAFVWNTVGQPKNIFICWLYAKQRLRKRDMLPFTTQAAEKLCLLCVDSLEIHPHLFFQCRFSTVCVQLIKDWLEIELPVQHVAEWWKGRRFILQQV